VRITELDCQIEDILWFALDKNGLVAAFFAGGCGNIPEEVCRKKENLEILENYFTDIAPVMAAANFTAEQGEKMNASCSLYKECSILSSKGIVCYDVYDNITKTHTSDYHKVSYPSQGLRAEHLPQSIKSIMWRVILHDVDFETDHFMKVVSAYYKRDENGIFRKV
jgi:hypothetical protein